MVLLWGAPDFGALPADAGRWLGGHGCPWTTTRSPRTGICRLYLRGAALALTQAVTLASWWSVSDSSR